LIGCKEASEVNLFNLSNIIDSFIDNNLRYMRAIRVALYSIAIAFSKVFESLKKTQKTIGVVSALEQHGGTNTG